MSGNAKRDQLDALGQPLYPPTDASGDIDLNLLELSLRMTPAERIAHHNGALELVLAIERAAAGQNAAQPSDPQTAE